MNSSLSQAVKYLDVDEGNDASALAGKVGEPNEGQVDVAVLGSEPVDKRLHLWRHSAL